MSSYASKFYFGTFRMTLTYLFSLLNCKSPIQNFHLSWNCWKIHILQNCHNVQKLPQWRQLAKINEMVMEKGGERHSHVSSLRTNQIRAIWIACSWLVRAARKWRGCGKRYFCLLLLLHLKPRKVENIIKKHGNDNISKIIFFAFKTC